MTQTKWLTDALAAIAAIALANVGDPATKAKVDALTKQLATDEGNAAATTAEFETAISALITKVAELTPPSLPMITAVSPPTASLAGGENIALVGTALLNASAVKINGVSATNVSASDDNNATFTNPPQVTVGAYDVIVTTPAGDSIATPSDLLMIS